VDLCGNPVPSGGGTDDFDFSQMMTAGFLNNDGEAAPGITYFYDNCSQTVGFCFIGSICISYCSSMCPQPFVYNQTSRVVISYDDATSFGMFTSNFLSFFFRKRMTDLWSKKKAAKGRFITDHELKGFAMWHVAGDEHDILLDSMTRAMNVKADCPS